ncbi:MAG TPA: PAS domain S-box protein [Bryobacteraceae bacterium]|nr:PAS domain S-box protein [Bryobacteraceae bacterium]
MILTLLCAGILAAGSAYYESQRRSMEAQIDSQLSAIADLKVQQIRSWLKERTADTALLAADPIVAAPAGVQSQSRLQNWLESFCQHGGYTEISLFDADGTVLNSAAEYALPITTETVRLVARAVQTRAVAMSDLHEAAGTVVVDFAAPVVSPGGALNGNVVVLRVAAAEFLNTLVQAWPGTSPTAEALLVRREGNRDRYLSKLRFRQGAALEMTLPVEADIPVGDPARGAAGIRRGVDYRGVPVLAALRQVPGTPWALIAKVDADEIYSPLRQRSHLIALAVGLLLAGCLATFGLFWHLQRSRFYRRQHQAELERGVLAERYAHLSSCVNDIVLLIGPDDRIVQANDRAAAAYGYNLAELAGLPLAELIDISQWPNVDDRGRKTMEQGWLLFESVHRRKDGSPFAVEVSSRVVDLQGRKFRQSIIRDISERKRADQELRRAARALQVLSASNQALIRSRDEATLFRAVCAAVTRAGGYPLAWIGFAANDERKSILTAACAGSDTTYVDSLNVTWGDESCGRGPIGNCIRAGKIMLCNDAAADPAFEPWRESAARYGYKSLIALPLRCEGVTIGALAIYASEPDAFGAEELMLLDELAGDLSHGIEGHRRDADHSRAEEALRQSAMEFRALFDAANDAIFIMDLKGRLLEVNQVACQRLGYSREELMQMTVDDIDSPAFRELQPARLAQLLERGQSLIESAHVRKDGKELPVEISSCLFDYRRTLAVLAVARDISDRKQAEAQALQHARELERAKTEAENASHAKSQFLANMSHEIRTPMNGILGMSSLLLDTALAEEQREYAETIRKSTSALLRIVNDVLDFSKIEAGKMELELAPFDMVTCLQEIGELMAPQAGAKGLRYVFQTDAKHCCVRGDAGRLRQVLLNLLGNAIKFTDHGQVTLRLADSEPVDGQVTFSISVADTGAGIRAEDLPRLFHAFTQVDSSTSKKHQGTGLGLAISQRLADLMHASLTVSSEVGRGTTFVLSLRLAVAGEECPPADPGAESLAALTEQLCASRRRVLLAEDNLVNQKIGVRLLEKCGCHVDVAADGAEAARLASCFAYDLIFMDCGMPGTDGYEATRQIRARERDGSHVPIVALTAHAIAGTREECLTAGMDDYIAKPVSPAAIERALLKWCPCAQQPVTSS